MIEKLNVQQLPTARAVLALQRASYMVEARLIKFYDIPPLQETLEALRHSDETFYGYFEKGKLAGAISFKQQGVVLDIYRLVVDPAYFRRGIASALLEFVETVAPGISKVIVSTGTGNDPAIAFYKANGFNEIAQAEVAPGVYITEFEKLLEQTH